MQCQKPSLARRSAKHLLLIAAQAKIGSKPLVIFAPIFAAAVLLLIAGTHVAPAAPAPNVLTVQWDRTILISKSTPTLQVVVNPTLLRGPPIHDGSFAALKALGADYVRYVPWEPYPKLAVAELDPPSKDKTSWDFSKIDPVTIDFLNATAGHSTIIKFSTIPAWMFKTAKPVDYPSDPLQVSGPIPRAPN
jgi:hypothetical protein